MTVLFGNRRTAEQSRVLSILRKETVGGMLLVGAALIALIWANSPLADSYYALRNFRLGIPTLHLELTLGAWASDGLLAIFFFLVGLELKRELLAGELRNPKTAVVPVVAAVGGVVVPGVIYLALNAQDLFALRGWAIPTATDIAFAVAVLALIGSHLPPALRIFLLTLAVVDDLIAIVIIAVFYTSEIQFLPLALSVIPIAVYAFLAHRFRAFFVSKAWGAWAILLPLGFVAWALVHASGVHATIAGVVLGFMVPVLPSRTRPDQVDGTVVAEHFEHRFRPLSAAFAVPVFAFFSAGVTIGGLSGFLDAITSSVGIGIIAALVLGKPLGIVAATWLATTLSHAKLDSSVKWIDLIGVGILGGIGFTVSLLVAELSFSADAHTDDIAKVAILTASILASVLAAIVLGARNRAYKLLERGEVTRETA